MLAIVPLLAMFVAKFIQVAAPGRRAGTTLAFIDAVGPPTVRRGETPAAWEQKPAKNRQKDKDARWTKKHGKSFIGYKNHVNADKAHKLIRTMR